MNFKKNSLINSQIKRICQIAFISMFSLFSALSCSDQENNGIPLVQVNFQIALNDPAYINLQTVNGSAIAPYGSRGIILYRISPDEIRAYDRHCTFQSSNTCALVSVDPNNITATDQCCGSSFLLTNGDVSKPPASIPLKQYNAIIDGNQLIVTN